MAAKLLLVRGGQRLARQQRHPTQTDAGLPRSLPCRPSHAPPIPGDNRLAPEQTLRTCALTSADINGTLLVRPAWTTSAAI